MQMSSRVSIGAVLVDTFVLSGRAYPLALFQVVTTLCSRRALDAPSPRKCDDRREFGKKIVHAM